MTGNMAADDPLRDAARAGPGSGLSDHCERGPMTYPRLGDPLPGRRGRHSGSPCSRCPACSSAFVALRDRLRGSSASLFLWMHTFMKDVPKVGMRSGLERMATGTAFAAQTLQDMTGQAGRCTPRHGIDPRPGTATVVAVTDTGMLVNARSRRGARSICQRDDRREPAVRGAPVREVVGKLHAGPARPGERRCPVSRRRAGSVRGHDPVGESAARDRQDSPDSLRP